MRLVDAGKRERAADHGPQLTAVDERLEELELRANMRRVSETTADTGSAVARVGRKSVSGLLQ
jgi:hypothetical protein